LRLGTRLTLYLSLIITLALSCYGYLHTVSRKELLVRMMKTEVGGIGETLRVSLEKLSLPQNWSYVQELIDSMSAPEQTLGAIVYDLEKERMYFSSSLKTGRLPFADSVKNAIQENRIIEEFRSYQKVPVFSYSFPLRDPQGRISGGASILQRLDFIEEEIARNRQNIFLIILALIGAITSLVYWVNRKGLVLPIRKLIRGTQEMAEGRLDTRIELQRGDEISELAQAVNHMAAELKKAQEKAEQEAEFRLNLERHLRQAEKLAVIGQIASGLAHEIGTPLNIIGGRTELIKRKLGETEGLQKNLDVILQQTEKIAKIIRQLLGFVRKKKPESVPVGLDRLLEATLDFLSPQAEKNGVKVRKSGLEKVPWVKGDPDQLQQVFLNLIVNAFQAMPRGGTLTVEAASRRVSREGVGPVEHPFAEIIIRDTGPGMTPEVQENIFHPFFTTKEAEKGTGLGLTIARGIVQDHEGWIEVQSEPGKGSRFAVYLPAVPPPEKEPEGGSAF
jgi:signal transduction histidine kinase